MLCAHPEVGEFYAYYFSFSNQPCHVIACVPRLGICTVTLHPSPAKRHEDAKRLREIIGQNVNSESSWLTFTDLRRTAPNRLSKLIGDFERLCS